MRGMRDGRRRTVGDASAEFFFFLTGSDEDSEFIEVVIVCFVAFWCRVQAVGVCCGFE